MAEEAPVGEAVPPQAPPPPAPPPPAELVSTAEIRAFRTSMSARRFPALRDLKDEDIASLVLAERRSRNARMYGSKAVLENLGRAGPLEDFRREHLTREHRDPVPSNNPPKKKQPFSPVNPTMAKDDIFLKNDSPYNTLGTPYDSERYRYVPDHRALPFVPNAPSEAKKTTAINYYMNSPDAETLDMERQYIADRSAENSQKFWRKMKWDRSYSPRKQSVRRLEAAMPKGDPQLTLSRGGGEVKYPPESEMEKA